jgi:hypothetical protein
VAVTVAVSSSVPTRTRSEPSGCLEPRALLLATPGGSVFVDDFFTLHFLRSIYLSHLLTSCATTWGMTYTATRCSSQLHNLSNPLFLFTSSPVFSSLLSCFDHPTLVYVLVFDRLSLVLVSVCVPLILVTRRSHMGLDLMYLSTVKGSPIGSEF